MRYYKVETENGTVRLPSVTTILDVTMPLQDRFQLEQAKIKNPARSLQIMTEARQRGDYIHRYVSARLQNQPMGHGLYGQYLRHIDPLVKAIADCNPRLWLDTPVHDLDYGYAGTFDLLAHLPEPADRLCLCDLKSTAFKAWPAAIHAAQLQAAAYAAAWNQQHHILRAEAIATIHVSPYSLHIETSDGEDLEALIEEFYERIKLFGQRLTAQSEVAIDG